LFFIKEHSFFISISIFMGLKISQFPYTENFHLSSTIVPIVSDEINFHTDLSSIVNSKEGEIYNLVYNTSSIWMPSNVFTDGIIVSSSNVSISSLGDNIFWGNVGINTNSPLTSVHIVGGLLVDGNLQVLGDVTYIDTFTEFTSALKVVNVGSGPAVDITQTGNQPVLRVFDDNQIAFFVDGRDASPGFVGINTDTPNERLTIVGNVSSNATLFAIGGNSNLWNSAYEISTVYQNASGNFTLNTNFQNFQTSVQSATATLLPTTVYQNASGNWQKTYEDVQQGASIWYGASASALNASKEFTSLNFLPLSGGNITGNLGVNAPNASERLTIVGNVSSTGSVFLGNSLVLNLSSIGRIQNNGNLHLKPTGTGALVLGDGGNARGNHAVDLQKDRSSSSQVASGNYSTILGGRNNTASGTHSTASGYYSNASGFYSTASGRCSTASGDYSTASGCYSNASGCHSTASGCYSTACGNYSTASGYYSTASGTHSKASGSCTTASAYHSTASGYFTTASGTHSTASGDNSIASGCYSTVSGDNSTACGVYSTASGYHSTASGYYSTASGRCSTACGAYSIASGNCSTASGCFSTASGYCTIASGYYSTASGFYSTASGYYSTASGYCTTASAYHSTASGYCTTASGTHSTANGDCTIASGYLSTASGRYSNASGCYSNASGSSSTASGCHSTASGRCSTASGCYSTASGYYSTALGCYSTASGCYSTASGANSTASGYCTTASGNYSTACGYCAVASGCYSTADGYFSTACGAYSIARGYASCAYLYGSHTRSGHYFLDLGFNPIIGGSQVSNAILINTTTNNTPTTLFLNGSSARITIPNEKTILADIKIVARQDGGTNSASWQRKVLIHNNSNTVSFASGIQTIGTDIGTDAGNPPTGWGIALSANDTNKSLDVNVTGANSTDIRWIAAAELVEIYHEPV
jgi:hypothetical protein